MSQMKDEERASGPLTGESIRLGDGIAELAKQVEERTADLVKANRHLKLEIEKRRQIEEMLQLHSEVIRHMGGGTVVIRRRDDVIVYANPSFEEMFGYFPGELVGKKASVLHAPNAGENAEEVYLKIVQTLNDLWTWSGEILNVKKGGTLLWCRTSISTFESSRYGTVWVGVFEDITERKEMEEALRSSEARYRAIVEDQTELVSRFLPDGTLTFVNGAYCRYFGESPQKLIGKRFWHHVPEKDLVVLREHLSRLGPETPMGGIEHRVFDSCGRIRWQQWTDRAILDCHGRILEFQAVGRDITERKESEEALRQSEKQLRALSSRLLTAQEEERKRIAGEVHDCIGSTLTGIKIGLETSLGQTGRGMDPSESLEALIVLARSAMRECRRIMTDLRPTILDDYGIVSTASWFCEQFHTLHPDIHVRREINVAEEEISAFLKTVIFRVLQEAFSNVSKHSRAWQVHVSIERTEQGVELLVQDNGRGFDLEASLCRESSRQGLGLASMRERVELSGGIFSIESARGMGTTIRACWPHS